jgi:peptide/nickel transport system ATP-binding protein
MSSLVELNHVSVQFRQGRGVVRAVEDVSLEIKHGETLALVGESGSGKTTLGHIVAGLRAPNVGAIRFSGQSPDRAARRAVQIVFQDPFGALDPRMPVASIIAEPLRIQGRGTRSERRQRAQELAVQVGLPTDALNRYPHEFSGGQRQRIAIARALAPDPALIVADEPLSALDVSIQSQIINLLRSVQESRPLAYLFISHDLAVVHHLADRVAVLYLGRLVELAPRRLLFETPSHPYTAALLAAVPRIGQRGRASAPLRGEMPSPLAPPPGCVFHTRCPKAQAVCRAEAPKLLPAPGRLTQVAACHFKD